MGAPKGHKKYGGRQKGTPNKSTEALFELCKKNGIDVFEAMVVLACEEKDKDKKFYRLSVIAEYLYAKRKAVEVSEDPDRPLSASPKTAEERLALSKAAREV